MRHTQLAIAVWLIFFTVQPAFSAQSRTSTENSENLLFYEDFSQGMNNWWTEGGGRVWIQDGRLNVKAVGSKRSNKRVCTVWCRSQFPSGLRIEFDAHVISSPTDGNNINLFFSYSDPNGVPLFESRHQRATGAYVLYHQLNGYIITYLHDIKHNWGILPDKADSARFRLRRCPGFHLMQEKFSYHCRQGETHHIIMTKSGNRLTYNVDGTVYLDANDKNPLPGGMFGLRTASTYLWWDNVKVYKVN